MKRKVYSDIVRHLQSSSPEENAAWNRAEVERAKHEYDQFLRAFEQGICYLCNEPIEAFFEDKPCCHWLLNPKGFKKKHFPSVFGIYGFYQLQSYLRWVASRATPCRDINDLIEEHSGTKRINLTIRWGKLEWSFSCSDTDIRGHVGNEAGSEPHYHFQMALDGKVIIKYSDFHPPLNEEDLLNLYMTEHHPDLFRHTFAFGDGMQTLMAESGERLLKGAHPTADAEHATLHIQTIITAKDAEGIADEDMQAVIEEARQKGVTIASLAHKLGANVHTIIEPGPGVPQPRERRPRGKGR